MVELSIKKGDWTRHIMQALLSNITFDLFMQKEMFYIN